MNERDLVDALTWLFDDLAHIHDSDGEEVYPPEELVDEDAGVERVNTFEGCGVLTMNEGLVVRMRDGSEFQLTVVRSR